ncbi:MAG: hypothetical protein AAFO07_21960 [Bacteroidota bacterium]
MQQPTYDQVAMVLQSTEIDGNTMYCSFISPRGQVIESEARLQRSNAMQDKIQRDLQRAVVRQTKRHASRLLRSALGGGVLGRTGSSIIRNLASEETLGIKFSQSEKEAAIVEAFTKVSDQFKWDQNAQQWVDPSTAPNTEVDAPIQFQRKVEERSKLKISRKPKQKEVGGFEKLLIDHPLQNHFEKEILARMLVELANADNDISVEEKEFLSSLIPPEVGSINTLLMMDPISPVEGEELNPSVKKTVYTAAWVMSFIDMSINSAEKNILMEYADMFGMPDSEVDESMLEAQRFVLKNNIDTSINREELYQLADQIEMSRDEAERVLINLKKSV